MAGLPLSLAQAFCVIVAAKAKQIVLSRFLWILKSLQQQEGIWSFCGRRSSLADSAVKDFSGEVQWLQCLVDS